MIYLASPYSNPPECQNARFQDACRITAALLTQGDLVFSPIVYGHPIACMGELGKNWETWRDFNTQMLGRCDELAVAELWGWRNSEGVRAELLLAESLHIPIAYIHPTSYAKSRFPHLPRR